MKKFIYPCLIALALILLPLAACQTTPASESTPTLTEAADDIVFTPGGITYRANVQQQGVINPWLPIETDNATFQNNGETVDVRYRSYIVSEAGKTRNNIVNVRIPHVLDIGHISLEIASLPDGIEVTQGGQYNGPPGNGNKVLAIEISGDVPPGEYTFEIIVGIEGVQYGSLPCTLNIVEGTFAVSFPTSTREVTLDEANDIVGVTFPTPGYLPSDYAIKKIFIFQNEIILLISDKGLDTEMVTKTYPSVTQELNQFQCRMEITISWISDGFYIPPAKIPGTEVIIKGDWAKLTPSINPEQLWLYHQPNPEEAGLFEIVITTSKTISGRELITIAENMQFQTSTLSYAAVYRHFI